MCPSIYRAVYLSIWSETVYRYRSRLSPLSSLSPAYLPVYPPSISRPASRRRIRSVVYPSIRIADRNDNPLIYKEISVGRKWANPGRFQADYWLDSQ